MAASGDKHRQNDLSFLPERMRDKLMPFQREGVLFGIKKNGRVLIADEMGLGKTLQALSVAYFYKPLWPLLVVVPASLRYPWIEEIEKWIPDIHPHDINLIQGGADTEDIPVAQITVVTYGLLRHPASKVVQEALYNQKFQVIIVDESHYIKNRKSATTKYLVPLIQRSTHKILLTGTPALARPEELFPQIDSILPGKFGSWTNYAKKFCDAQMKYFGRMRKWVTDGACNLEELQQQLTDKLMIRRLKANVLTQLPPKQRQKIPFELKDSQVKKQLDQAWDDLLKGLGKKQTSLNAVLNGDVELLPQGTASIQTEETFGDPAQLSQGQVFGLLSAVSKHTCYAKLGPVKEYLKMLCENQGLKFIVFAHHRVMMDSLAEQLMDDGVKFIRIDGNTAMQERPTLVHQFQADTSIRCALLSIKAAGVGLTLTAAKLVVFAELDWTPGTLQQCEDRAHRIGQKDTVNVHYLVAKGTIDDWVWGALCRKTTVVTTTLNGQTQALKMDYGNDGQIQRLAGADAYIPVKREPEDLSSFFQSPSAQKSILDFFTPGGHAVKGNKKKRTSRTEQLSETHSNKNITHNEIVVIDECDEDEFLSPNTENKQKRKRKQRKKAVEDIFSDSEVENSSQNEENGGGSSACGALDWLMQGSTPLPKKRKTNSIRTNIGTDERVGDDIVEMVTLPKKQKTCLIKTNILPDERVDDDIVEMVTIDKKDTMHERSMNNCENPEETPSKPGLSNSDTGVKAPSEDKALWGCSVCTYLNHQDLTYCEMCSTPKRSKTLRSTLDQKTESSIASETSSPFLKSRKRGLQDSEKDFINRNSLSVESRKGNLSQESLAKSKYFEQKGEVVTCIGESDIDENSDSDLTEPPDVIYEDTSANEDQYAALRDSVTSDYEIEDSNSSQSGDDETVNQNVNRDETVNQNVNRDKTVNRNVNQDETMNQNVPKDASCNTPDKSSQVNKNNQTPKTSGIIQTEFQTPPAGEHNENDIEDIISQETMAAKQLFSPGFKKASKLSRRPWECPQCDVVNDVENDDCDGCLAQRPDNISLIEDDEQSVSDKPQTREVNLDNVPVYDLFKYCCSKNTSRVYLYTQADEPLHVNFTPLDVELDNLAELPDLLLRPENLRLVRRFIREWNSLSATKRRMVIRSGEIFVSPSLVYDQLKSGRTASTQRYHTKLDTAQAALTKAEEIGGTVRVIQKPKLPSKKPKRADPKKGVQFESDSDDDDQAVSRPGPSGVDLDSLPEKMTGVVQAMSEDGTPLCLNCQKPYKNDLVSKKTVQKNAWQTRFCNKLCAEQYWMKSSRGYTVKQVYQEEGGICQICGFDAHKLFTRIKNTSDQAKRARLLQESKFKVLSGDVKQKMVRNPTKGLFWQVDHIRAVVQGGGMCDIDNLRTLCVPCHRDVTSQLLRDRAKEKRMEAAAKCGDITAFFSAK